MARNSILFRLLANRDDAEEKIDAQSAQLDELGKKKVTAEVLVDAEQAKAEIAEVDADLKTLPKRERIVLQVEGEEAKLAALESRIKALQSQQAAMPEDERGGVTQRIGNLAGRADQSSAKLEKLRGDLDALGQGAERAMSPYEKALTSLLSDTESLGQDTERAGSRMSKALLSAGSAGSKLSGLFGDLFSHIPVVGGMIESVFGGAEKVFESASTDLGGLVSQLPEMISGFAMAAPVVLILAAAMSALVISLGEALLGVVALGIAFLAALGPIALVLGVVVDKIKDIVEGQTTLASAAANLKSAYEAQTQAVTELHQAEQNENTQRLAALQAQRAALLAVKDAEDQVADDRLNVQNARLQLESAQLTLAQFKQGLAGLGLSPSSLDAAAQNVSVGGNFGQTQAGASQLGYLSMLLQWKEDLLGVKQGYQGIKDANDQLNDSKNALQTAAENWHQYVTKGLRAYQPYQQALNSVKTSQQNLARSDDQLASAELAKAQAIKHGATEASSFMGVWDKFKHTMSHLLGPAEQAVFEGIERALGIMAKHLGPLEPAFLTLGQAIGQAFVWWAKMISKPENMKLLSGLIKGAAAETKAFSHWFGSVFKLVVEIADDAMPALVGAVENWAGKLSNAGNHQQKVKQFIDECVSSTKKWFDEIGSVLTKLGSVLSTVQKIINTGKSIWGVISAPGKFLGKEAYNVTSGGESMYDALNAAAGKQLQQANVATWEKELTTGKYTTGKNIGQQITATFQKWLETNLSGVGVNYRSLHIAPIPVTPVAANGTPIKQTTHVHAHFAGGHVTNPDHFASTLRKRLSAQGGGVK